MPAMPVLLQPAEFFPADLPLVADFSCGTEPWEVAMADWIKAPPTARFGNSRQETSVWLYFHPDGRVVGFGSLGMTRWTDPYPSGPWRNLSVIPALAIQTEFQHLPRTQDDDTPGFSHQILGDLLGRALLQSPDFVVLCVHRDNHKAMALYQNHFGFKFIPGPDSTYKRMQRRLR